MYDFLEGKFYVRCHGGKQAMEMHYLCKWRGLEYLDEFDYEHIVHEAVAKKSTRYFTFYWGGALRMWISEKKFVYQLPTLTFDEFKALVEQEESDNMSLLLEVVP